MKVCHRNFEKKMITKDQLCNRQVALSEKFAM